MLTIFERENLFDICYDNENVKYVKTKEFFSSELVKIILGGANDIYIHNLNLWAVCIIKHLYGMGFKDVTRERVEDTDFKLEDNQFFYILSASNAAFYNIDLKYNGRHIRFIEYKNLFCMPIEDVCEEFGGTPSIAMHRSMEMIYSLKVRGITISSCAYALWKKSFDRKTFANLFHDRTEEVEKICRDAYHGGLCYINEKVKKSKTKRYSDVEILDINSLYPYIMKNCRFPIGSATYGKGEVPEEIRKNNTLTYYVRFRCAFKVKENCVPFARTRCDKNHFCTEKLEDSCYIDRDGRRYDSYEEEYVDEETGEITREVKDFTVELCMYKPEYELFLETYDVWNLTEIEYCWYYTAKGIFDNYIDFFYNMKKNAKTKGERRIAKLFMNALSGRMSLKTDRRNFLLDKEGVDMIYEGLDRKKRIKGRKAKKMVGDSWLSFISGECSNSTSAHSHVEIGAAITSEAMVYIIRKINANFDRHLYTDTDSLHLLRTDRYNDIKISEELGDFKVEHSVRTIEYFKEKVYFNIDKDKSAHLTFAGLPTECQEIVEKYIEINTKSSDKYEEDIRNLVDFSKFIGFAEKQSSVLTMEHLEKNAWDLIDPSRDFDIDELRIPRITRKIDYEKEEAVEKLEYYKINIFD